MDYVRRGAGKNFESTKSPMEEEEEQSVVSRAQRLSCRSFTIADTFLLTSKPSGMQPKKNSAGLFVASITKSGQRLTGVARSWWSLRYDA
jgi:hypothetical protein